MADDKMAVIKLAEIRENKAALREVDRTSTAYAELVDSIAAEGILNPILVREAVDEETGASYFALVDGLHRVAAAKDAGISEIPALIKDIEAGKALIAQWMTNFHRIETKPHEYAQALRRMLSAEPTLTITELAGRLTIAASFISQRLGLLKLAGPIAKLVDDGKISLVKAYALAKLPEEEQGNFLDLAMTAPATDFVAQVQEREKAIREAKRQGKDAKPIEFVVVARIRKMKDMQAELENAQYASEICDSEDQIAGFKSGVMWALSLDEATVAQRKAEFDARKLAKEEATARRVKERAAKKATKAAEDAVKAADAAAKYEEEAATAAASFES